MAMGGHYCRGRYDLVAILKTLGAGPRSCALIVGQWLMVPALSALTGGAIGLLFEEAADGAARNRYSPRRITASPASGRGCGAIGAMTTISLLVVTPTGCCSPPAAARAAPRCGGQRLAAEFYPAGDYCGGGRAVGLADGRQYVAVGGAGGRGGAGAAVRRSGLDAALMS